MCNMVRRRRRTLVGVGVNALEVDEEGRRMWWRRRRRVRRVW